MALSYILRVSIGVMAKRSAEQIEARNVATVYVGGDYLEPFNEVVKELDMSRSEYLKMLVLRDLVAREKITDKEVRRVHRYLLED